jgi:acyl carrier protein
MMDSGDVRAVLSEIWSEILGLETVDPRATFVDLGGTSIAAERIASRVREALNVAFKGVEILRFETLEQVNQIVSTRYAASCVNAAGKG